MLQIIHTGTDFNASKKAFYELVVAAHGNALVAIVEVVVIKSIAHGKAFNDECWQLLAASPPLLFRITFDELRINVRPDKGNGLFFEIFGSVMPASARCWAIFSAASLGVTTPHIFVKVFMLKGKL